MCFRCHWAESSLFLLIFHILRRLNFCCSLKLLSYNIKTKLSGKYKTLLVGLVWFFKRFKSDSPHNCSVFRDRSWACAQRNFFVFSFHVFSSEHYFNFKTHCGGSFNVLLLAHANLNMNICNISRSVLWIELQRNKVLPIGYFRGLSFLKRHVADSFVLPYIKEAGGKKQQMKFLWTICSGRRSVSVKWTYSSL